MAGNKVKFKAITNGIDLERWVLPEIMQFYRENEIIDRFGLPTAGFRERLGSFSAEKVRELKKVGRRHLNRVLEGRVDSFGERVAFSDAEMVFGFKRRFVDYKRPLLPFTDTERLKAILRENNAHYVITGRVHDGDERMMQKLEKLLGLLRDDEFLRERVHYLPDYDEELALALSVGTNASINMPIVGLEACGTSWMKDVANLGLLISTHDGGVADGAMDGYLNVSGSNEAEEVEMLYQRMDEAAKAWGNDFDLEYWVQKQLSNYLEVVSGARMLRDYLEYLF